MGFEKSDSGDFDQKFQMVGTLVEFEIVLVNSAWKQLELGHRMQLSCLIPTGPILEVKCSRFVML